MRRRKKRTRLLNFEIEEIDYIKLKDILEKEGLTMSGLCRKKIRKFITDYENKTNIIQENNEYQIQRKQ